MAKYVWCVLVSALVVAVLGVVPVHAEQARRAPASYPVTNVSALCIDRDSRATRWPGRGTCRPGEKRTELQVAAPLDICLLPRGGVLAASRAVCRRRDGVAESVPARQAVFVCASRRTGLLRGDRPSRCRTSERALRSRDLAPTDVDLDDASVPEDAPVGTPVGALLVEDPDAGDQHVLTLVDGRGSEGNAAFAVVGGQLVTARPLDAEAASSYGVRVRATDLLGRSTERALVVSVGDVAENVGPTDLALTPATVLEGRPSGTTVGTLTTTDRDAGDRHAYALVTGPGSDDNPSFEVVGDVLRTREVLDHETTPRRTVRLRSTDDAGASVERAVVVTVGDGPDGPTALSLSPATVVENLAPVRVGTLTATDPDVGDRSSFALVPGPGDTDNAAFATSGDGLVLVVPQDAETRSSLTVRVRATDTTGATFEQALVVAVTDGPDAPTAVRLSPASVAENSPVGTTVGALTATDQDTGDTHSFALVAGPGSTDNAAFSVDGATLRTARVLDHEQQATYAVRVRATDSTGRTVEGTLVVSATNAPDAPSSIDLAPGTVAENSPAGTSTGTLAVTDQDAGDTVTFSVVGGPAAADLAVDGARLVTTRSLDFESTPVLAVRVRATDGAGLAVERDLAVTVTDGPDAPTAVGLSGTTVAEGVAVGTEVGRLSASDQDAGETFSWTVSGTDLAVDGDRLVTAVVLDHEVTPTRTVTLTATDRTGRSVSRQVTVTVTDVAEAATAVRLQPGEVDENRPAGTSAGTLSADDPDVDDTLGYALVPGTGDTDNALFAVSGDRLLTTRPLDREVDGPSFSVRVRVRDAGGLGAENALTIRLDDGNDVPTAVVLSPASVQENLPAGTRVGALTTTDQDAGDTHAYTLLPTAAPFRVDGAVLLTTAPLDREGTASWTVPVRTDDGRGGVLDTTVIVTVLDAPEAPTAITLTPSTLAENQAPVVVGTLRATDPDSTTATFSLVPGAADNAGFAISGDQLRATTAADFETRSSLTARVTAVDPDGLSFVQDVAVTVVDGNDAPVGVVLSPAVLPENQPAGTVVGLLSTQDEQPTTVTFALEGTPGGPVRIQGRQLVTTAAVDFERLPGFTVGVRATDSAGLSTVGTVTVTVTDVNEAPGSLSLVPGTIPENSAPLSAAGQLAVVDPDSDDTAGSVTFTLVPGTGDRDNARFRVQGATLQALEGFDAETQPTLTVRVRATDRGGLSTEQAFTVRVTDVDEAPTGPTLDGATTQAVRESTPVGTSLGMLETRDPDAGDTPTFSIIGGDGTFVLRDRSVLLARPLDHETAPTVSFVAQVTDRAGLSSRQTITITVTDVDEAPLAQDDTLTGVVGGTEAVTSGLGSTRPATTLSGALLLANDTDPEGAGLTVVPQTGTRTTLGGTVSITAAGDVRYLPPVGVRNRTGAAADTVTYAVTDGTTSPVTATLRLEIADRLVWWVDAAAPSGGDGRSTTPFTSYGPLTTSTDPDGPGDEIYTSPGTYAGGLVLEARQVLIGAASGLGTPAVAPAAEPVVLSGNGPAVTAPTDAALSGLELRSSGTGTALRVVRGVTPLLVPTGARLTGTGTLLAVDGTDTLVRVATQLRPTGSGRALVVTGASGPVRVDQRVVSGAAPTGGVAMSGSTSTLTLADGVALSTGSAPGIATVGGTLVATGTPSTLVATTGTPLTLDGTSTGSALVLASVSSDGAASGVVLAGSGTARPSVRVAGTGAGSCGGSITGTPGSGTSSSTSASPASCGGGTIARSSDAGIRVSGGASLALTGVRVTGGSSDGVRVRDSGSVVTLDGSLVDANGSGAGDHGIEVGDPTQPTSAGAAGNLTLVQSTVAGSADDDVAVTASAGTSAVLVGGSQLLGAGRVQAATSGDGLRVRTAGTATLDASVTGSILRDNRGDHVQLSSSSSGVLDGRVTGNRMTTTATTGTGGGVVATTASASIAPPARFTVTSNTILRARASAVQVSQASATGSTGPGVSALLLQNAIGLSGATGSCSATGRGIDVAADGGGAPMALRVSGNTVQECAREGIRLVAGDGAAVEAAVTGNSAVASTAGHPGILLQLGLVAGDTRTSCLDVADNAATGTVDDGLVLWQRFGTVRLPAYDATTGTTGLQPYLSGRNPATPRVGVTAEAGTARTGGFAACSTP